MPIPQPCGPPRLQPMDRLLLPRTLGRTPAADAALAAALCLLAAGGLLSGQVDEHPLAVTLPVAGSRTSSAGPDASRQAPST